MIRYLTVVALICWSESALLGEEPPKELKEMIEKAGSLLEQRKFLEYYQLTTSPKMKEVFEKKSVSLEQMALIMEKVPEVAAIYKKAFGIMKSSECEMNQTKTEATFQLPKLSETTKLGNSLSFELVEKRWYLVYK